MKKIIFYQSKFSPVGGVETFAYNWCWWLRNFFDVTILYCTGDYNTLNGLRKLVKVELYEEGLEYECDIFIRNSVWGKIPQNIKAKRMIEMRHANYKYLLDKGLLYKQYTDMGIKEIVGCGEYVSKMSNLVLKDNPTTIKNILMPKRETNKVLHLISCTRLDPAKGWNRMLKLVEMLKDARIKFEWNVFTNSKLYKSPYEELRIWNARKDIWDYLADADYTVLLSDSEGLPYTIQESLQYQVPCIVTDVGGCTELIKDGVNGYVVPLDMNFDVRKLLNIPKCQEYNNNALEEWLNYLGYDGEIDVKRIIEKFEEEKEIMVKVKAIIKFTDLEENKQRQVGDVFMCTKERADYLVEHNGVEIVEEEQPTEEVVSLEPETEPVLEEEIEPETEVVESLEKEPKGKKKKKKA